MSSHFQIRLTALSFFVATLASAPLFAGDAVEPSDAVVSRDHTYYTHQSPKADLIYTKKNLPFAQEVAMMEGPLHASYEKTFGYTMDEKLHVGLISEANQIANGFSTQFPNNRQINYIGGAEQVDYFAVASWLKTLIYHETSHNYQLNAKNNGVSKALHAVFRNGGLTVPWFTIPNIGINSFILEGNAVLNESWHGNGGRLYSGRFLAETLLQVKAGGFTPALMYNTTLRFPYGEHFYVMGSHLQYYLAKTYGLDTTNRFFMTHSKFFLFPFLTNTAMEQTVGKDFETVMKDYVDSVQAEAQALVEASGAVLTRSKFFSSLNRDANEIFFIGNRTGVEAPHLVRVDRTHRTARFEKGGFLPGKVVKLENGVYTQSGHHTSPFRITQGLFDRNAVIKPGTESKMIQGTLKDGTLVYFDVPSSYDHPRLFVGATFYADVNSSVVIDERDALYYFVQKDKTRTLMRNQTPLASFQGFYGVVCDVDAEGRVYFVANSRVGSTLYRTTPSGLIERVSNGDNVVDARLLSGADVLVAALSARDYYYAVSALQVSNETPYETTLFFEKEPFYGSVQTSTVAAQSPLDLKRTYRPFREMNYSATNFSISSDEDAGTLFDLVVRFEDPLTQNSLTGFASKTSDAVTVAGAGYRNAQTRVAYEVNGFGVLNDDDEISPELRRHAGLTAQAVLPWLKEGYWHGNLSSTYSQDYESDQREPLGATLSLLNRQQHGLSLFANRQFYVDGFGSTDRGDGGYGGTLRAQQGLAGEWYVSVGGRGSFSRRDSGRFGERRGVKINSNPLTIDLDPGVITMPSIKDTAYVRNAVQGSVTVRKVFNLDKYFFTFPVSLRREALFATYNHYTVDTFLTTEKVGESIAGITLDTVFLNNFPIPLTIEYLHHDNRAFGDRSKFRVRTEVTF